MVKVKIASKRGRKRFRILEGTVWCSRMNATVRRSGAYSGPLTEGVHKTTLSHLGYDRCDSIR